MEGDAQKETIKIKIKCTVRQAIWGSKQKEMPWKLWAEQRAKEGRDQPSRYGERKILTEAATCTGPERKWSPESVREGKVSKWATES